MTARRECCGHKFTRLMHDWHTRNGHAVMTCPVCQSVVTTTRWDRLPHHYCSEACKMKVYDRCPTCIKEPGHPVYGNCDACRKKWGQTMKAMRDLRRQERGKP